MTNPSVLVATWSDGLFVCTGQTREQEHAGRSVRGLAADGYDGVLAIIDGRSLQRRTRDGRWTSIATADVDLACCVGVEDVIYVGTDDARVLRVSGDGAFEQLRGFDAVAGRETWFAGTAVVDGRVVGPPLGVRSIAASQDGSVIFANVHVGGIPRSTDGGVTWQPTIAVEADVHEVRVHPSRPGVVMAAAAVGLCSSYDNGATWNVEASGLHAPHCSAVAFAGDDVLVSASTDPFAPQGAIYRRPLDRPGSLVAVGGGLPRWLAGAADTNCIATEGSAVAIVDKQGNLYLSLDAGRNWTPHATGLPAPMGLLISARSEQRSRPTTAPGQS